MQSMAHNICFSGRFRARAHATANLPVRVAKEAVDLAFNKSIESLKRYEFIKAGNNFKTAFIETKRLLKDVYWYKPFEATYQKEFLSSEKLSKHL